VRRRDFLGLAPALLVAAGRPAPQDSAGPADPLRDPTITGQARAVVTPRDNLEAVKNVELRLKCTCGCSLDIFTCRTTDFTCTLSPALHQEVLALFDAGKTPDEIVQAFVARHGEAILMAPRAEGFNLVGYLLPSLAVVVAGSVLGLVLLRKRTRAASAPVPAVAGPASPAVEPTAEELERLRATLEEIR
jgi:cytochrome c-type biogenesis protein CcmH